MLRIWASKATLYVMLTVRLLRMFLQQERFSLAESPIMLLVNIRLTARLQAAV